MKNWLLNLLKQWSRGANTNENALCSTLKKDLLIAESNCFPIFERRVDTSSEFSNSAVWYVVYDVETSVEHIFRAPIHFDWQYIVGNYVTEIKEN